MGATLVLSFGAILGGLVLLALLRDGRRSFMSRRLSLAVWAALALDMLFLAELHLFCVRASLVAHPLLLTTGLAACIQCLKIFLRRQRERGPYEKSTG